MKCDTLKDLDFYINNHIKDYDFKATIKKVDQYGYDIILRNGDKKICIYSPNQALIWFKFKEKWEKILLDINKNV